MPIDYLLYCSTAFYLSILFLQHLDVIVQTQSLSRILATVAIKKLLMLNSSAEQMQSQKEQNQPGTPMDQNSQTTGGPSSVNTVDSTSIRSERLATVLSNLLMCYSSLSHGHTCDFSSF